MNDLLGDPVPETPAMNAPLPWRVFEMTDLPEYYVARSLEEAKAAYLRDCGEDCAEYVEDACELSDDALNRLTILMTDEDEEPTGEKPTFREYLDSLVAGGLDRAQFFAGSE